MSGLSRQEREHRSGLRYRNLLDQWAISGTSALDPITALYAELVADGRLLVVGPTGTPRRDPE